MDIEILTGIIDSKDEEQLEPSKEKLPKYLKILELKHAIILANKQDLPNAVSVEQVQ